MSSYENAPATKLVATHCACCARPLVDALSVETGIGPECRKKHGFAQPDVAVDLLSVVAALAATLPTDLYAEVNGAPDARTAANRLTYRIAAQQDGPDVLAMTNALIALGFLRLAARIAQRLASVTIELAGADLLVKAPYNEAALGAWRAIRGRRWDKQAKATRIPALEPSKRELHALLKQHYPGAVVCGPKGLFRV